ncbi:hypothetical protein LXL04_033707 [Taraxacum kok-saghyz]
MHDLINDLATSVASDSKEAFDNFRHVSLVGEQCGSYRKLKELQRAKRLRSLLLVPSGWVDVDLLDNVLVELLPQLRFLRVLSLTNGSIMEAPKSICHLKHLRYLNFSYTEIISLPEQLSDLYNLQSLLVHGCVELYSFPESFRKLINLRHLDLCNTLKVERMPLRIGGLTSLQTLSKVNITEGANGFKISDLKDLLELKGRLSIMGLDKVINPVEEKDANLHQKKGLGVLKMEWSDEFEESWSELTEYEVLKALRPHHKLEILKISFYMGTTFPNWVGDPPFDRLTKLTFYGCRNWERWLTIRCDDTGTTRSLPHLRKISIKCCPNLSEISIGLIPSLRILEIRECSEIALRSIIGASSSLVRLVMADVKGLTQINEEELMHLGALGKLDISFCNELRYLSISVLVSLQELCVARCKKLESYNCSSGVEELQILFCGSFTSLAFSTLPSSHTESIIIDCHNKKEKRLGFLPLRCLQIRACDNFCSFPHEHLQSFTSLEEMEIIGCPRMDSSFPCGLWPRNISTLRIGDLKKPMSEWGLLNFPTSLVELSLYGINSGITSFAVVEDEIEVYTNTTTTTSLEFLLPSSLVQLKLFNFEDVESLSEVLQRLKGLKCLYIKSCPKLKDLPQTTSYVMR